MLPPARRRPAGDAGPLWRAWREGGGDAAREALIAFYLPFARMLTAKIFGRRTFGELEFVDFMQYAAIGLIEAIDRFDPERAIKFETFAVARINGAILNGIASLSEKQVQVRARQRADSERIASLKEGVSEGDEASDLFVLLAELAVDLAVGIMLEEPEEPSAQVASYLDNTYQRIEMAQLRRAVKDLVDTLPENEKKVVSYHYMQQLAFDEIALILKLSKGRISQLHRMALARLREGIDMGQQLDVRC